MFINLNVLLDKKKNYHCNVFNSFLYLFTVHEERVKLNYSKSLQMILVVNKFLKAMKEIKSV